MQPAEQLTFLVLKKEGIRRVRVHTYTTHMYETGKDYKTLSGKGGESYGGGTWRRPACQPGAGASQGRRQRCEPISKLF